MHDHLNVKKIMFWLNIAYNFIMEVTWFESYDRSTLICRFLMFVHCFLADVVWS